MGKEMLKIWRVDIKTPRQVKKNQTAIGNTAISFWRNCDRVRLLGQEDIEFQIVRWFNDTDVGVEKLTYDDIVNLARWK